MHTQIVHVSRFRDSLTAGALPLAEEFDNEFRAAAPTRGPDVVSIHQHLLEAGRCLVVEWAWDSTIEDYAQLGVTNVASIDHARQYVPGGAERRRVPEEFGLEAWVVA